MTGRLRLALEIDGDGAHPAAGRRDGGPPDIETLVAQVTAAEAAGFALVTLADSPLPPGARALRIEAGVRAAFLARRTSRIGLAPTLHTTVTEPFHLATQLASLDHASLGRGAWVVGAEQSAAAFATVGEPVLSGDDLRREIADVIDVARKLWDSWEDDAIVRDRSTGRFLDPDRVHHVTFTGARFSVIGPLITPRPPQGQLVVLGADTLGVTGRLDVALIAAPTFGELAARAHQARADGAPLVFADLEVLLNTENPAQAAQQPAAKAEHPAEVTDRLAALDAITPWGPPTRLRHTGTTAELRALLDRLAGVVDGVRLHPAVLAADLPLLIKAINTTPPAEAIGREPIAREPAGDTGEADGVGDAGGPGDAGEPSVGTQPTLRDILGLPRPVNRFAAAG